jgi:hypothetical protein
MKRVRAVYSRDDRDGRNRITIPTYSYTSLAHAHQEHDVEDIQDILEEVDAVTIRVT